MLDAWNILEDKTDELVGKFEIISYKSIKRDGLNTRWERVKALAPGSLLSAIVTDDAFKVIRRNLRKDTGILVGREEVYRGISRLLNEAAAKAMSSIKVPQRVKRTRKAKIDKEESTSEQEGTFPE